MALIAIDVGGTKIAGAFLSNEGEFMERMLNSVSGREGREIGRTIMNQIDAFVGQAASGSESIDAIGICVPGIFDPESKTVWAPNLPGWESYPLYEEVRTRLPDEIPIQIDSDRSCYILGEVWKGNARGCDNAIFVAVGTGIGAGILVDGQVLRGVGNSAGAVGWMALDRPHREEYAKYGCFEFHASGAGLVRNARNNLSDDHGYQGRLSKIPEEELTARDLFTAYEDDDPVAVRVIEEAIAYWGMGVANLVSIFNPEKIILGGGVFKTAGSFLERIKAEAGRWAQPIAINEVSIELAALGSDAGLYGAGYLALSARQKNGEA